MGLYTLIKSKEMDITTTIGCPYLFDIFYLNISTGETKED